MKFLLPGWGRISQQIKAISASGLLRSSLWATLGETLSRGLLLLAMVFTAHVLSQDEYGVLGLLRTTLMALVTVGGIGLGVTANRYLAEYHTKDPAAAGSLVGGSYVVAGAAGLLTAVLLWVFAPQLAEEYLKHPELVLNLRWCAIAAFLGAISGAQIGVLQGLGAYRILALVGFAQGLVGLVLVPAGAALKGVDGAVLGILLYNIVGTVLLGMAVAYRLKRLEIKHRFWPLTELWSVLLRLCIPAALCGLAIAPFRWVAETQLARQFGFAELGIFGAAMLAVTLILSLVSTLNAPLVTFFGSRNQDTNVDQMTTLNLYGTWYAFCCVSFPLLVHLRLVSIPFGRTYDTKLFYQVFLILLIYCGLMLYYSGIVRVLIQRGNLWMAVLTNLMEGGALICAAIMLRELAVLGLALAFVISYIVRTAVTVPILFWSKIIRPAQILDTTFFISALAFGVLVALNWWLL